MKALYASLIAAGLMAMTGCNTSPTGGSTAGTGKHTGETSKATFKLSGPSNTPETSVKHGEGVTKDITIDAGKDFKDDITFETNVEPADKGVTANVEPKMWKASDSKKVQLHIKASKDAPKGEYTINIVGKPATGEPNPPLVVKIKVPEPK